MKSVTKAVFLLAGVAMLSSCGGRSNQGIESSSSQMDQSQVQLANPDLPMKLGSPFTVGSTTYTPEDVASYDDVGYASVYGQGFNGRPTANGEAFVSGGFSAAHKTLPMPSYVEVTALDTGRTILVRINDRGPFANDRLIDLSEGAARQLGIIDQGLAGVRVRRVNPPEQERAVLRVGQPAAVRIDTPESLLRVLRDKLAKLPKPTSIVASSAKPVAVPRVTPVPVPRSPSVAGAPYAQPQAAPVPVTTGNGRFIREGAGVASPPAVMQSPAHAAGFVVQIASYSTKSRAMDLARKLGANVAANEDGTLFRVRYGPYASESEAQHMLETAKQRGYPQAKLFHE